MAPVLLHAMADRWVLGMSGLSVDRCCFDYCVTLDIGTGVAEWGLQIGTRFRLADGSGAVDVEPGQYVNTTAALRLLHGTVVHALAFEDGCLSMSFADGTELNVLPDERYEAWTVTGPERTLLVSIPGGGLAVWEPSPLRRLGEEG